MKPLDYTRIVPAYYDRLLQRHGDDVLSLDWGSAASQELRFRVLSEIADLTRASILDVGCGRGDLLTFLKRNGFQGRYVGVDLTQGMVELARRRHSNATFLHADILKREVGGPYDFVLASGIFYLRVDDPVEHFRRVLARMAALASQGVAFNALSDRAREKSESECYFSADLVLSEARRHGRSVKLRDDYKENDFTVYVYKQGHE